LHVQEWLGDIPAVAVYALVALVVGVESLGIPLPGEIVLVSAALLASQGHADPWIVAACGSAGAVGGDSIGYAIGRKGGRSLLDRLGARFPKHFSPANIAVAEGSFQRWGMGAVFFGRFMALLRIFAGPLAGVLRMPYWKFLVANLFGGVIWAGGTTAIVYYVGTVAEPWLTRFSYLALALGVLVAAGSFLALRRRARRHEREASEAAESVAAESAAEVAAEQGLPPTRP
jgi:membrane protein DedA with SNARE-associated domain